jgi:hypothetical protein
MDLWLAQLVLTHLLCHHHHPSLLLQHTEFRVSNLSFLSMVLFLWQAAFFLFFCQAKSCFSALPFWVNMSWELPFYLAHWPPSGCLDYCFNWAVVGQSIALSFETLGLHWASALPDQPPLPDHLKNHLIWVVSIKVILLAGCRMSLELLVGTCKFPTTLVTLSLQLWI